MVELLSEKYLNNNTDIVFRLYNSTWALNNLYSRFLTLKNRYSVDYYNRLLNPIADLIGENIDFFYLLIDYFENRFPLSDNSKSGIERKEEMKKLSDLTRNLDVSNKNQTMVLNNLSIDEIYSKRIVQVSNVTLHKIFKLVKDFRSRSTLHYDVVLPFNDKNYDANSTDCTRAKDLTWFYLFSGN